MRVRLLAVAVVLVAVAAGCASEKAVSLRPAERAFARAGIPLRDWSHGLPQGQDFVTAGKGQRLQAAEDNARVFANHVRGSASSVALATRTFRMVYVMDSASFASKWVALARKERRDETNFAGTAVLVAGNVIYIGTDDAAARRAMASLRK